MSEKIVQLNGEVIKGELRELVRGSVEEALNEMYLAGVSARRLEDIAEVLWGSKAAPSTISERNKKAYIHIWGLISETRANLGKRSPCTLRCHRGRLRAGGAVNAPLPIGSSPPCGLDCVIAVRCSGLQCAKVRMSSPPPCREVSIPMRIAWRPCFSKWLWSFPWCFM